MGKYIHFFETIKELEKKYWGDDYTNPWVSYTEENEDIRYKRDEEEAKWKKPLTFEILSNGTVGWRYSQYSSSSSYACPRTIQYRINDGEWTSITSTTSGVKFNVKAGDVVEFRGDNDVYSKLCSSTIGETSTSGTFNFNYFTATCDFNVAGNITSLINSTNYKITSLREDYPFAQLFYNCSYLRNANRLRLPLTTLPVGCYAYMFTGCSNLISTPTLPALNVPDRGYWNMFDGCTSLETMPELPATTVGYLAYASMFVNCTNLKNVHALPALTVDRSYQQMFAGCTSLETAPEILATNISRCYRMYYGCTNLKNVPDFHATVFGQHAVNSIFYSCTSLEVAPDMSSVTSLGESCCYNMFYNCKKLKTITGMPSTTTLASYCYAYMFSGCTSLETAPVLPATAMETSCYANMFNGCTSLTTAPELPSTALASNCYWAMFSNCSNLTQAPALPASVLFSSCYESMFEACTKLAGMPQLNSNLLAKSCYNSMFKNCTSLTSIPTGFLPASTLAESCYQSMFYGCTGLTSLPEGLLPATTLASYCYYYMFDRCTGLTSLPSGLLPATTLASYCYANMFEKCTGLTSLPSSLLPATTLATYCYRYMFYDCTGLISLPNGLLPATNLVSNCYEYMFDSCTGLNTLPSSLLPATTLANDCYRAMFDRCTNLSKAPDLLAETLVNSCYGYMFYSCTKLNYVKCLAKTGINNSSTSNWLNSVANKGAFIKDPSATWSTGDSGVPETWVVANFGDIMSAPSQIEHKFWGESTSIASYTSIDFNIVNNNDWITITKTLDLDNLQYTLDITTTYTDTTRTGTIQLQGVSENVTKTITISQNAVLTKPTWSINLNDQWVEDTTTGPDGEKIYKSNSNHNVPNGIAKAYITINNYDNFKLKVKTYGQSSYDYLTVSQLDKTAEYTSSVTNNGNIWSGYSKSSTNYYDVDFTNIDKNQHTIELVYWKNGSTNSYDDRAYVYVPVESDRNMILKDTAFRVVSPSNTFNLIGYAFDNWTITNNLSWVTLSQTQGNAGIINITGTITESSEGSFTINCGGQSIVISVVSRNFSLDDLEQLESITLSENEYVDVGVLNPNNWHSDNSNQLNGQIYIGVPAGTAPASVGVFINDGNVGFRYTGSGTSVKLVKCTADGTETNYSTSLTSCSAKSNCEIGIATNVAGSMYNNNINFINSNSTCYLYYWPNDVPYSMVTSYWKIGGHFRSLTGITVPILYVQISPHDGSYPLSTIKLLPYVDKTTGKKYFVSPTGYDYFEVKTEE